MNYEFLWVSLRGANWIPCQFICHLRGVQESTIRYFDDFLGVEVEAAVEDSHLRQKPEDTESNGV